MAGSVTIKLKGLNQFITVSQGDSFTFGAASAAEIISVTPTTPTPTPVVPLKDSGERQVHPGGFIREPEIEKLDLTWLFGSRSLDLIPREMLERWLQHMENGAKKYDRNNWLKAEGPEAVERFRRSAARHFQSWLIGDDDEDHLSAIVFNVWAAEVIAAKGLNHNAD